MVGECVDIDWVCDVMVEDIDSLVVVPGMVEDTYSLVVVAGMVEETYSLVEVGSRYGSYPIDLVVELGIGAEVDDNVVFDPHTQYFSVE